MTPLSPEWVVFGRYYLFTEDHDAGFGEVLTNT